MSEIYVRNSENKPPSLQGHASCWQTQACRLYAVQARVKVQTSVLPFDLAIVYISSLGLKRPLQTRRCFVIGFDLMFVHASCLGLNTRTCQLYVTFAVRHVAVEVDGVVGEALRLSSSTLANESKTYFGGE